MHINVLILVLFFAGVMVSQCDGYAYQHNRIDDKKMTHRVKRGMTPAVKGVLAWRKLLMNSKPDARFSTNHYNAYYKKGDFSDALNDFLSVVPNARKSTKSEKLTIYEGTVGNRKVILREHDKGVASRARNSYPTIEITTESGTPDKVFYMGKEWIYRPGKY